MTTPSAVSEKEALRVVANIKAGKGTVMGEARRLGVYHATLRKALRAAIGEKAFGTLMGGRAGKPGRGVKPPPSRPTQSMLARRAVHSPRPEVLPPPPTPLGCTHSRTVAGTDGSGYAVLWCTDCDFVEHVQRVWRPSDEKTDNGPIIDSIIAALSNAELTAMGSRIAEDGSSLGREGRAIGLDTCEGVKRLRDKLREFMGREAYDVMMTQRARYQGQQSHSLPGGSFPVA